MNDDLKKFASGWANLLIISLGYEDSLHVVEEGLKVLTTEPVLDPKAIERMKAVQEYLEGLYAKCAN